MLEVGARKRFLTSRGPKNVSARGQQPDYYSTRFKLEAFTVRGSLSKAERIWGTTNIAGKNKISTQSHSRGKNKVIDRKKTPLCRVV